MTTQTLTEKHTCETPLPVQGYVFISFVWQSVPDSRLHLYYLQHYDGFLVLLRSWFRSWKVPKPAQKSFCWLNHRQESGCEPGFWCHSIAPCTSSIQSFRCRSQTQSFHFEQNLTKARLKHKVLCLTREPFSLPSPVLVLFLFVSENNMDMFYSTTGMF